MANQPVPAAPAAVPAQAAPQQQPPNRRLSGDADAARRAVKTMDQIVRGRSSVGVCIVIHGEAGVGKTFLASGLDPAKTAYVNIEGGQDPLAGWKCDAVHDLADDLSNLRDILAYIAVMKSDERRFLFVDQLSNLEKRMLAVTKNVRGKEFADIREHGDVGEKEMEIAQAMVDARRNGVNVVLLAHTSRNLKGLTGCAWPMLQGRASLHLVGIADAVGYMFVDQIGQRIVQWQKSPDVMAKSRYDCLMRHELVPNGRSSYLRDVFARVHVERMQKAEGSGAPTVGQVDPDALRPPVSPDLPTAPVAASTPEQVEGGPAQREAVPAWLSTSSTK